MLVSQASQDAVKADNLNNSCTCKINVRAVAVLLEGSLIGGKRSMSEQENRLCINEIL